MGKQRMVEQTQTGLPVEEGVRFFGKVSASISHEIKNVLAIINEHAGLLEDIAVYSQKADQNIDPKRLVESVFSIKKQVFRADSIVKKLNRFSHSTDEKVKCVNLGEEISLFVQLAEKAASNKEVELKCEPKQVVIHTAPFLLLHLLWCCLEHALGVVKAGSSIQLTVGSAIVQDQLYGIIYLSGTEIKPQHHSDISLFPGSIETALVNALGATLLVNTELMQIQIRIASHVPVIAES